MFVPSGTTPSVPVNREVIVRRLLSTGTPTPTPTYTRIPTLTPTRTTVPLHRPTYTRTPPPNLNLEQLPECIPPAEPTPDWPPCRLEWLPDERWVILHYGQLLCGDQQRRLINLSSLETQELGLGTYYTEERNGRGTGSIFVALSTGRLIFFSTSHCQGGDLVLFDPDTGEVTALGWYGDPFWNQNQTAFIVQGRGYTFAPFWGYNVETNSLFLPAAESARDSPIWTPDGNHLLYQQTVISYTALFTLTATPREIYRVNAYTGETQLLAGDPHFHYFLCARTCAWNGDWIPVRRIVYQLQEYFYDYGSGEEDPNIRCLFYSEGCPGELTEWQLNWQTGELRPLE
jgi:hypothetical protein